MFIYYTRKHLRWFFWMSSIYCNDECQPMFLVSLIQIIRSPVGALVRGSYYHLWELIRGNLIIQRLTADQTRALLSIKAAECLIGPGTSVTNNNYERHRYSTYLLLNCRLFNQKMQHSDKNWLCEWCYFFFRAFSALYFPIILCSSY